MRGDDENARRGDAVDERSEILLCARIDPVQVLEDEHQGPSRGATERHRDPPLEDALSAPSAVHGCDGRIAGVDGEQIPDERNVRLEPTQVAHALLDLRDDLRLPVELVDTKILAKLVDDRQERARLAERHAAALEPGRWLAAGRQAAPELEHQS